MARKGGRRAPYHEVMLRFAGWLVGVLVVASALPAQTVTSRLSMRQLVAAWREGDLDRWPEIAHRPAVAAPALIESLADRVHGRSEGGVTPELRALSELGVATPEVLEPLLELIEDCTEYQAALVLRTVGDLAPYAEDVSTLRVWVKEHPCSSATDRIARVLGDRVGEFQTAPTEYGRLVTRLDLRSVVGMDDWRERLDSENFDVCEMAAERLAEFGERAKSAVPRLAELLADTDTPSLISWKLQNPFLLEKF